METSGDIKLSPEQVPGSVGEAMCCFALAQAAQVDVDPTIFPALERMYGVEVRTGNTVPSHEVKEKLWQIHEHLCDAVEAAWLDVRDLSEAVSLAISRCSEHGGT